MSVGWEYLGRMKPCAVMPYSLVTIELLVMIVRDVRGAPQASRRRTSPD